MDVSIGSCWKKWDLHFHTSASFDYEGGKLKPEEFVDSLLENGISVVAITDHHTIDIDTIEQMRVYAGNRLTIFPGIELRSEYGGKPIHYIGIFQESIDLQYLWDKIKNRLNLTRTDIRSKGGDESIYVSLRDAHRVFKDYGGIITIHAGAKSNSIENISNKEQFQRRLKLDLTKEYIDILEVGQLKDVLSYHKKIFPATGLALPVIIGSDNHNLSAYKSPQCWIKADCTFIGLLQVINEPEGRVFLGECPEILQLVNSNPARFIKSIEIHKKQESTLEEKWFDNTNLSFNPGLVAVVGNQGSGKSALTDILGLLGDCPYVESFAFLNDKQFLEPKCMKGSDFHATLNWQNGRVVQKCLSDDVKQGAHETIKYIPQFYLDEICDELKGGQGGRFEEQLKSVILSRIPLEERARKDTLNELIRFRTRDACETIESSQAELSRLTSQFSELEKKSLPSYRKNLEEKLALIEGQIQDHLKAKPEEVPKPINKEGMDGERKTLQEEYEKLKSKIADLDKQIKEKRKFLVTVNEEIEIAKQIRGSFENLEVETKRLKERLNNDLEKMKISFEDILNIKVNYDIIDKIKKELEGRQSCIKKQLDEDREGSLVKQMSYTQRCCQEVRQTLDLPYKKYAVYEEELKKWKTKHSSLIGDSETPDTQVYLKKKLEEIKSVPGQLKLVRDNLMNCADEIIKAKEMILNVSEELHKPVRDYILSHPIAGKKFELEFYISLEPRGFEDRFLNIINQGRRGSFYGEEDGRERLKKIIETSSFENKEGIVQFLSSILNALTHDIRKNATPTFITDQIRTNFSTGEILEYVFGLEYLEPHFELRWHGRSLDQLSPGERGTLLLIFFLLVDDAEKPLIIDQPEGNLDNQTVYELLVDCIKDAKKRRQIIIVTHNPNLAVLCDAEQVILTNLNKKDGYQIKYVSGALENPIMGNRIVDILEGTRPAIEKRMDKYRIIFD